MHVYSESLITNSIYLDALFFLFFCLLSGLYLGFLSAGANSAHLHRGLQTGFLVGRFVFTPSQMVASKTFKEGNHTDAFCFKLP